MANELAPDAAALIEALSAQPVLSFADMTPEEARAAALGIGDQLDLPPDMGAMARDLSVSASDGTTIPLRVYRAKEVDDCGPVILFLHGGGWVTGDLETHDGFCRDLAIRSGLRVVAVDYRRPPEHPFPHAFFDALAAAECILDPDGPLSDVAGLVVAGDSAGGGLAAALARALCDQGADVRAQLLFYPVLDAANRSGSYAAFAKGYLLTAADMAHFIACYAPREEDRLDPRCSPLLAERFEGLPPVSILTCECDVLRDEGRAYARRCAAAGVPVHHVEAKGQLHGVVTLRAALPGGRDAIAEVIGGLNDVLFDEEAEGIGTRIFHQK